MANEDKLEKIRHSMAHVMAEAVVQKFPGTKVAIGPAIDNGFYYDFDLPVTLTLEDLEDISDRMKEIIKGKHEFKRQVISRDEAEKIFSDLGENYKLELLKAIPEGEEVSLYSQDTFTDLCRGPHVENTAQLNPDSFKLLSIAGAYWRGKETNPMLTRIYGTAWENPKQLRMHLKHLEEMEKRDHRKLGKELDLYSTHEEAGPGLVYWHPYGSRIRLAIEDYWRKEHYKNGYELLYTPHLGKSWLWQTSGHLGFYNESMYSPMEVDENDYYIKPMNCPFHIMIYKTDIRSYRDLPLRWAELGTVYRYEKSGALHGLLRVRGFTQDDAHIICTHEQVDTEILEILKFSIDMWNLFGFKKIKAYVSTKPSKAVGDDLMWEKATNSITQALKTQNMKYEVDEGGGAFYGPKIDLKIEDAIGREWQMTTIQFDFNLPERFNMSYIDSNGEAQRPYMIHRAIFGSLERFFAVITEHFAGAFPLWLAPNQVRVLGVSDKHTDYVNEIEKSLKEYDFRVDTDTRHESVGKKIREGRLARIPYLVVIGDKELENRDKKMMTVRNRDTQEQREISLKDFIEILREQDTKKLLKLDW